MELFAAAALQEGAGLVFRVEFPVERGVDGLFGAFGVEDAFHAEIRLGLEGADLPFPVDDQAQGHRLDAAGRELRLDLFPEDGGEFETHEAVEHAAGLLGLDQVHVDVAGVLDGVENGVFRDLVEDDAPGLFRIQGEGFRQVPGDGFPFAVLIGSEPDRVGLARGRLQFRDRLFLVAGNLILRKKSVFDVDAQSFFLQIPDVSEAGLDRITFSEELFNRPGLGRGLHND